MYLCTVKNRRRRMKISINIKDGEIAKEKAKDIIVGIDLGTTNSLVAYVEDGQPKVVKGANGKSALVPSIVHFGEAQTTKVGDEAKSHLITDPQRTIYSVKRLMGKAFDDIVAHDNLGYKVIDQDKESLVKIEVDGKYYTPIELSAEILKALKKRIEQELKAEVSKAVITVPAYFNDAQRQATRDAGKLAGLDVLRIVNEPTAASLAYGIGVDRESNQTVVVYDLGGGTFDVSILQISDGIFEVLSTHGDTYLGGDDFDSLIQAHWMEQLGISSEMLAHDKSLSQTLRTSAETAKKSLSAEESYQTEINGQKLSIDRVQFKAMSQSLLDRTMESCAKAMADAKLSKNDIDQVILVGGSTRMPIVKEAVESYFEKEANDDLNPDEVVALGAAIQADILAGNRKDLLLLDITPLSMGIETVGGLMDVIISRNAKVPARAGRQYTTSVDGQTNLKIAVYQGERDLVKDNRKLGEFILKGIPPMPAGLPKIEIAFIMDADGILTVRAKELRSEVETQMEIRSTYGISEEDMARMLLSSIQNAEEDMKHRGLLEAINEANNLILSADRFVKQNKDHFTQEHFDEIARLKDLLQSAVDEKDKDGINQAMTALNEYAAPLAHQALDINIGKALKDTEV